MCGIAGAVGPRPNAGGDVTRMLGALRRRGPDGEGMHAWPGATFGHRRLAIFDLSAAGAQPMLSDDGKIGVVFNGAIYNFIALRSELAQKGFSFRSDTDTEVLIAGYRAWGIDQLVQRLRGMFAFALWDAPESRLFLVRDRLGVKPLVYVDRGADGVAFASTVRALRASGAVSELSPAAVADFLQDGFVGESHVIYAGAAKLPPATILEWSAGRSTIRRYWSPPQAAERTSLSFDDAVAETERLLLRAVETRLHADVPVASLLSAGIDSSLVCWAISRLGGDVTAFTMSAPGHPSDETALATETAGILGIRHQVLALSDADEPDVSDLGIAYAEPFACSSALGMLRLSRAIAGTPAKVFLTGDGGDDVFLGYPRHRMLLEVQRAAAFAPSIATAAWKGIRRAIPQRGALKRAVHLVDYTLGGLGAFIDANPGLADFQRHGLLGPRLADQRRNAPAWSIRSARRVLTEYLQRDLQTQFVSEYLVKVDGASMHYALEARSPFLDQELWEFASALPYATRLHGGTLKAILRELARRHLGDRVATAPKLGFTVPVEQWMGQRWFPRVQESLANSVLAADGWMSAPALQRELTVCRNTGRASRRLWYAWVLEEWLRAERAGVGDCAEPAGLSRSA
jgi:asparagine synthase (glutamine-hydrolysing)